MGSKNKTYTAARFVAQSAGLPKVNYTPNMGANATRMKIVNVRKSEIHTSRTNVLNLHKVKCVYTI